MEHERLETDAKSRSTNMFTYVNFSSCPKSKGLKEKLGPNLRQAAAALNSPPLQAKNYGLRSSWNARRRRR
jgi:hypothetical protein